MIGMKQQRRGKIKKNILHVNKQLTKLLLLVLERRPFLNHDTICVFVGHLIFDHKLVALHDKLQFVPLGPQGGQRVQAPPSHRSQQAVLLLSTLELRLDLHTYIQCMIS